MESEKTRETSAENGNERLARERAVIREKIRSGKEGRKTGLRENVIKCPECESRNLEHDHVRAEIVCRDCGLVLEENKVDQGPEWNSYNAEKKARTGPPSSVLVHDKGLSTMIDWKNRDSGGKYLSKETIASMDRLRKWQKRITIRNPQDRNLAFALGELDRMTSAMGLPESIQQTAAVIYRKAVEGNIIRGRSIEGMVTASLYAACKQHRVSRTLDEIATVSRVPQLQIGRSYRALISELKLGILPPSAAEFIPRFCSPFQFPDKSIQSEAEEIIRQAEELNLISGKGPEGIAASAIYIASRNTRFDTEVTQKKLAKIAGITQVTIRTRFKELVKLLHLEVEDT